MLDLEVVTAPTAPATDIVSSAELGRHMGLSASLAANAQWANILTDAITDAVDKLDGIGGELNRTLMPRTYQRFITKFPGKDECGNPKPILLPYPPLIRVDAITIEDGSSPENVIDPADYVVKSGMLIPEIHPIAAWPSITAGPRAASITYTAGYSEYPGKLRRMIKFLAAHYCENREATVMEMNKTLIDRKVLFALDDLRAALRISPSYDDWNE
ncbi:hypothetical protein NKJ09_22750 [Mesorhizobium sp. M0189]|uniref:hypothetical protein n=1 Tax=Mesorhizobium sp. M0189 TaxID=2956909 RepID=UPI00333CCF75